MEPLNEPARRTARLRRKRPDTADASNGNNNNDAHAWHRAVQDLVANERARHVMARVEWIEARGKAPPKQRQPSAEKAAATAPPCTFSWADVFSVAGSATVTSALLTPMELKYAARRRGQPDLHAPFVRIGDPGTYILRGCEFDLCERPPDDWGRAYRPLMFAVSEIHTSLSYSAGYDDTNVRDICTLALVKFFGTFHEALPKIWTLPIPSLRETCKAWMRLFNACPPTLQWEVVRTIHEVYIDTPYALYVRGPRCWQTRPSKSTGIALTFHSLDETDETPRVTAQRSYRAAVYTVGQLNWRRERFCNVPALASHFVRHHPQNGDIIALIQDHLNIDDAVRYAIAWGARSEDVRTLLWQRAVQRWGQQRVLRWMSLWQTSRGAQRMTAHAQVQFYLRCICATIEGPAACYRVAPAPVAPDMPIFECEWRSAKRIVGSHVTWETVMDLSMCHVAQNDATTAPGMDFLDPMRSAICANVVLKPLRPYTFRQELTRAHATWAVRRLFDRTVKEKSQSDVLHVETLFDIVDACTGGQAQRRVLDVLVEWCREPCASDVSSRMVAVAKTECIYYTRDAPRVACLVRTRVLSQVIMHYLKQASRACPNSLGHVVNDEWHDMTTLLTPIAWYCASPFCTDSQRASMARGVVEAVKDFVNVEMEASTSVHGFSERQRKCLSSHLEAYDNARAEIARNEAEELLML